MKPEITDLNKLVLTYETANQILNLPFIRDNVPVKLYFSPKNNNLIINKFNSGKIITSLLNVDWIQGFLYKMFVKKLSHLDGIEKIKAKIVMKENITVLFNIAE